MVSGDSNYADVVLYRLMFIYIRVRVYIGGKDSVSLLYAASDFFHTFNSFISGFKCQEAL